jgi:hypothetical protein
MRPTPWVALLGIAACVPHPIEQPVPDMTVQSTPAKAPEHVLGRPATDSPSEDLPSPRLVVEHVEAADKRQVQRVFSAAAAHIKECSPHNATILHVRLQGDDAAVRITLEPGLGVNAELRRCVLEALSTVDVDDLASRATLSNRASGFTALLRVEW